jgi:hypothetical protein
VLLSLGAEGIHDLRVEQESPRFWLEQSGSRDMTLTKKTGTVHNATRMRVLRLARGHIPVIADLELVK